MEVQQVSKHYMYKRACLGKRKSSESGIVKWKTSITFDVGGDHKVHTVPILGGSLRFIVEAN